MQIRVMRRDDLEMLPELDGSIHAADYLHVEQSGETMAMQWKIEPRPLRSPRIVANPINEDQLATLRQILTGVEEGTAIVAEHDAALVALLVAQPRPQRDVLRLLDLRVDSDHRRQGLATAMLYQLIQQARESGVRGVEARTRTDNGPAATLLSKCGFDLSGLDTRRQSNHDLVKEAVTLFWYAQLK